MRGTMQEYQLGVRSILEYGAFAFPDSKVFTYLGDTTTEHSFKEIADRSAQLANALADAGIGNADRVATFCFNHNQHLEAYYAIPAMGAVLHTLNIRLFEEQLRFVINDAADRFVICDGAVLPLLAKVLPSCPSVERVILVGPVSAESIQGLGSIPWVDYEAFLAGKSTSYNWPDVDENQAAAMCYTSGTTGSPKGVVYSHRSTWLHSIAAGSANSLGLNREDRALVIVPMFHANAWGIPYAAFMAGADMVMPTRFLQAEPLAKMIEGLRPTIASGVPTIWNDLLHYSDQNPIDMSSIRLLSAGGSAVPASMIEAYKERFGIWIVQGWGMTETSPLCTLSIPPRGTPDSQWIKYLTTAGAPVAGVEIRIVDADGQIQPCDGSSLGEIQVRGPWITGSYYHVDNSDSFSEGWLRTGDIGTLDAEGYLRISDRTKDVIKSGGEWVSSVELENAIMAHPGVYEAAVIGVPDPKWDERPLACVVPKPGYHIDPKELKDFLSTRVAKWWLPERWSIVEVIPKTSVGKFDKKVLRNSFSKGELDIHEVN